MEPPSEDGVEIEIEDDGAHGYSQGVKADQYAAGISSQIIGYLEAYGWLLLLGVVVFIYVRAKWTRQNPPSNDGLQYDADDALARQLGMDRARQRMQEKLDAKAAQYAEEQKRKEEEKRKAKIEDWDRHKQGKGYRSKYRPVEEESPSQVKPKSAAKRKPIRDNDYNPLTGDGGSCSWRPGSSRAGGGG